MALALAMVRGIGTGNECYLGEWRIGGCRMNGIGEMPMTRLQKRPITSLFTDNAGCD
jgi:hypothetical protein